MLRERYDRIDVLVNNAGVAWDTRIRDQRQQAGSARSSAHLWSLWSYVDHISTPTLVLRGQLSDSILDEDAQELADRLTDARWTSIPNAGHIVRRDKPSDLTVALKRFFDQISATASKLTPSPSANRGVVGSG
jgi:pimeloyl-ACP methyl ester carboxylesterase